MLFLRFYYWDGSFTIVRTIILVRFCRLICGSGNEFFRNSKNSILGVDEMVVVLRLLRVI
jgi:hypothetical protein